jgi:hypothetical protein
MPGKYKIYLLAKEKREVRKRERRGNTKRKRSAEGGLEAQENRRGVIDAKRGDKRRAEK